MPVLLVRGAGAQAFSPVRFEGEEPQRYDIQQLRCSPGGKTVVATDGDGLLLVSHDEGHTFSRRPWPSSLDGSQLAPRYDPWEVPPDFLPTAFEGDDLRAIAMSGRPWRLYVTDDDGHTWRTVGLPPDVRSVDFDGRRGLAFTEARRAWTTADAGASWSRVDGPSTSEANVACSRDACLVHGPAGMSARVGWGSEASPTVFPADAAVASVPTPRPLSGRSPIRCVPTGDWTSFPGSLVSHVSDEQIRQMASVTGFGGGMAAYDVDLTGVVRWIQASWDQKSQGQKNLRALEGFADGATRAVTLFGPGAFGPRGFGDIRIQTSDLGLVAAVFPHDTQRVELAWVTAKDGKVHRATIAPPGAHILARILLTRNGDVRIVDEDIRHTFFVAHENGAVEREALPYAAMRLEAPGPGAREVWAKPAGHTTSRSGMAFGLLWVGGSDGKDVEHFWTLQNEPSWGGIATTSTGRSLWSASPDATLLVGIGEPENDPSRIVRLPTQATLPDRPPSCPADLQDSVRLELPPVNGARHPVTVRGGDGPNDVLLATQAFTLRVLRNGDACVGAMVANDGDAHWPRYRAMLFPGDPMHGSLLKIEPKTVSHRPLRCDFESGAVPEAFRTIEGF
jgi:hypothetical protein